MNTRLQVEHPVTELVTGLDLVEQMIRIAAGEKLPLRQGEVSMTGWAIESRIYAEDPYRNFLPSVGRLTRYRPPEEIETDKLVVRNDTGVFEGGEISTFYDPMIAKLCTWAPDRSKAIEAMADALDGFEIEGVGHNIPFLSAVMEQDRFKEGRLTTGYIAEEFPDGFTGVDLGEADMVRLAATAVSAHARLEGRGFADNGTLNMHAEEAKRAVLIGGRRWDFHLSEDEAGEPAVFDSGGAQLEFLDGWLPGDTIARAQFGTDRMFVRMDRVTGGFRMRYRGADVVAKVLRPKIADLMVHMPVKLPPDMSKFLLCPMPGQVVRLDVEVGQVVEDGQPLAIVEAMKMENVLRAEKRSRVSKIHADVGAVLAVDEVIMEFEDV